MAAAAYNLAVILGDKNLDEAVTWCQKAFRLCRGDPKYAHTLAFFQRQKGNVGEAIRLLQQVIQNEPHYVDAYLLLGEIYEERHDISAAVAIYRNALKLELLPPAERRQLEAKLRQFELQSR